MANANAAFVTSLASPLSHIHHVLDALLAHSAPTHLAVAVSGGADSMALTLLAHDYANERNIALTAFTVDHGLRPESASEAVKVAAWLKAYGIAHHILTPALQPDIRNPQAQARARRYDALAHACEARGITHLLLGHHADDQAETVALQQHRGDSPPSRAGMAAVSPRGNLQLVRPLLGTRKRALMEYLKIVGQEWIEDPSNQSERYARNRVRKSLSESEIVTLWHTAQQAGLQRQANESARNAWMQAHAMGATFLRNAWLTLTLELRMDYLSHAIRVIGGKNFRPRFAETERLCTRIAAETAGVATLGHCRIAWNGHEIAIRPEHPASQGVDAELVAHHMTHNTLVSPAFWCFNFPLQP